MHPSPTHPYPGGIFGAGPGSSGAAHLAPYKHLVQLLACELRAILGGWNGQRPRCQSCCPHGGVWHRERVVAGPRDTEELALASVAHRTS